MTPPAKVLFHARWREELVGSMDGQTFVVELTMGKYKVYFPTQARWEASAPAWAKPQWERVRADLTEWCQQEKIPLVIADDAWVCFE